MVSPGVSAAASASAAAPSAAGEPTIGVLALQGDVAEHVRAIGTAGGRPVAVRRGRELDAVDGLVIPGGESTTIWKLLDVFDLAAPLRARIDAGMPVFGSCAGMILLAGRLTGVASDQQTLGAIDMTVRRNAFGRQLDSFESDITLTGVPGPPFRAVFIRAPWVDEIGPAVEVLAWLATVPAGDSVPPGKPRTPWPRTPDGTEPPETLATEPAAGKIVAVRQGRALATAFHPELTQDNRVHKIFIDMVREGS